jgi:hypothetical protein
LFPVAATASPVVGAADTRDETIADEWRMRVRERHRSIMTPQQFAVVGRDTQQRLFEAHDELALACNRCHASVAIRSPTHAGELNEAARTGLKLAAVKSLIYVP